MSEPLDAKEMWDALTYDQRLAATAEVFEAICEHAKSSGSFRYLIYNRLKFNHDAYSCLYAAGGMAISNMCNDCKELVDEPEESSTYLPPKPDSDSQPKWDITPPKDNQFKCQNCGQIHELGPYKLVKSQAEDVTESMTNTLSNTTGNMNTQPWTAEAPTQEGTYWYRDNDNNPSIVEVYYGPFDTVLVSFGNMTYDLMDMRGEWQGPLKPGE